MSPVPEPVHSGRGGPGDGEEELNPPPGIVNGPLTSSSDEEADNIDAHDPNHAGYQPLPQDYEDEQEDGGIDYSSLSGLMSALNTHGPNVIESGTEDTAEGSALEDNGNHTEEYISLQTQNIVQESAIQRWHEENLEQAAIWNANPSDQLSLDGNKVEEIKAVMASFTLPQSAIPPWAQNLSDEDWKNQVKCLISRKTSK
ncbi:hypothetical protein SK128_012656 [Halocaridina rubra]|uniref:Male-enhanced antigen 1 n=1 Tax=Halocaridina rubra TaxID=373956 RepID=A0AAN8XBX5_HALRR